MISRQTLGNVRRELWTTAKSCNKAKKNDFHLKILAQIAYMEEHTIFAIHSP